MKIVFSRHIILDKIPQLKEMGFIITTRRIINVIRHPDHVDNASDELKFIASKSIGKSHVLRVVYKIDGDIIKAITIYPTAKGRYF